MAILIEAYTVILRNKTIEGKYPGGLKKYKQDAPNGSFCTDEEICGITLMVPEDVKAFIKKLEGYGLAYLDGDQYTDIALVCQLRGLLAHCDWLQFIRGDVGDGMRLSACRMTGSQCKDLFTWDNWQYERSLSRQHGFTPDDSIERSLKFLHHKDGVDVYLNLLTNEKVYVGRANVEILLNRATNESD